MNNQIEVEGVQTVLPPFLPKPVRKKRVLTEQQILDRIRKRATYKAFVNMGDRLINTGVPIQALEPSLNLIHHLYNRWHVYKYRRTANYAEESLKQYINDIKVKYNES